MALHPDFPESPHVILDPKIRWFPADETLREQTMDRLMPPLVAQLRRKVQAIETIVWLVDVVGAKDKHDLMRFDSHGAVSANMFDETWLRRRVFSTGLSGTVRWNWRLPNSWRNPRFCLR